MKKHSHEFVEAYDGLVGFGFDRQTDEKTVMVYLQKFSDDHLLARLIPKMKDAELTEMFECLTALLKKYLSEEEYHRLFLKDSDG